MLGYLLSAGFLVALAWGMPVPRAVLLGAACAGAAVYVGVALLRQRHTLDVLAGARPPDPTVRHERLLMMVVDEMAIAAGISRPRTRVVEDVGINAYAYGWRPETASLAVTTGALAVLSREELQAVVAHELGHIVTRDTRTVTVGLALAGLPHAFWKYAVQELHRLHESTSEHRVDAVIRTLIAGVVIIIAGSFSIISRGVFFALKRNREYQADAYAVLLTRNPGALVRALRRADQVQSHEGLLVSAMMFKVRPGSRWFSSHPTLRQRLRRLRRFTWRATLDD